MESKINKIKKIYTESSTTNEMVFAIYDFFEKENIPFIISEFAEIKNEIKKDLLNFSLSLLAKRIINSDMQEIMANQDNKRNIEILFNGKIADRTEIQAPVSVWCLYANYNDTLIPFMEKSIKNNYAEDYSILIRKELYDTEVNYYALIEDLLENEKNQEILENFIPTKLFLERLDKNFIMNLCLYIQNISPLYFEYIMECCEPAELREHYLSAINYCDYEKINAIAEKLKENNAYVFSIEDVARRMHVNCFGDYYKPQLALTTTYEEVLSLVMREFIEPEQEKIKLKNCINIENIQKINKKRV